MSSGGDDQAAGTALVTGASRGIGAAVARALADGRWRVAVNYRADADGAAAVVEEIAAVGGTAIAVQADVRSADDVERMFATIEEELGPVAALVNNAGMRSDPTLTSHATEGDFKRVVGTNLIGSYLTTRRALRSMLRARFGRVVNVSSIAGLQASAGHADYAVSKAGLIGLTKTVAVEVARRGVTINAVAPGVIDTEFAGDVSDRVVQSIPARRVGTPDDVAACVRFLVSDEAGYVTGTTIVVDGGLTAGVDPSAR
jgi:3-oxoacyl-[acyl-carrier protein] reductase